MERRRREEEALRGGELFRQDVNSAKFNAISFDSVGQLFQDGKRSQLLAQLGEEEEWSGRRRSSRRRRRE